MRLAVDTNILVQYLVDDDRRQADAAERLLLEADAIVISIPVFCELVWVLTRFHKLDRSAIAEALRALVDQSGVEIERASFEAGMAMLEAGGDFADGVIAHLAAAAKCDTCFTFDQKFVQKAGSRKVTLLDF